MMMNAFSFSKMYRWHFGCHILFLILGFGRCRGGYRYLYLNSLTEGQSITSHLIRRVHASSEIGCSRSCLKAPDCNAISFECKLREAGELGACDLISEEGSTPYTFFADPTRCTMFVKDRISGGSAGSVTQTVTSAVTTVAHVTAASTSTIVDMIDNVLNMCTGTSQADIAVVTRDAVYFYDDYSALYSGSCRTMSLGDFFSGFASLPDVSRWDAIFTVSNSYVDLLTDTKVFRWTLTSTAINPMGSYPISRGSYLTNLKGGEVATYIPVRPTWGVYRGTLGSQDVYFYEAGDQHVCFYSNQGPKEARFLISDIGPSNQNGKAVNPWRDLPLNTVALTAKDNLGIDFVGITGDLDVFTYVLPDPHFMASDPVVTTQKLVF